MTSLVLTSYRPHRPDSGAALRNWQNIQVLSTLGPVDVLSVGVESTGEAVPAVRTWIAVPFSRRSRLERIAQRLWPLRPGVYPGIDVYRIGDAVRWLRRCRGERRYDLAVVETISLAPYLSAVRDIADCVVFDAHNAEAALHREAAFGRSGVASFDRRARDWLLNRRMSAVERRVVRGAHAVWTCSERDKDQLRAAYGHGHRMTVVPNAVDVDAYAPPDVTPAGADWSASPPTLVYLGIFTYSPNEDAALRLIRGVLPRVREHAGRGRVHLVGKNPTPELLEAGRRDQDILVTGPVPTILPYLAGPCVVTVPLTLGSGTRLKLLEAFAAGRPVVSTAKGAEGLDVVDGEHLLIRESDEAIADAVVMLWRQPDLRQRLCANAKALVGRRYARSVAADRIVQSLSSTPGIEGRGITGLNRRDHVGQGPPEKRN